MVEPVIRRHNINLLEMYTKRLQISHLKIDRLIHCFDGNVCFSFDLDNIFKVTDGHLGSWISVSDGNPLASTISQMEMYINDLEWLKVVWPPWKMNVSFQITTLTSNQDTSVKINRVMHLKFLDGIVHQWLIFIYCLGHS